LETQIALMILDDPEKLRALDAGGMFGSIAAAAAQVGRRLAGAPCARAAAERALH
jgi:hypothetical protein